MKQNIALEQLEELTVDQFEYLDNWSLQFDVGLVQRDLQGRPYLNMGQMIQFINERVRNYGFRFSQTYGVYHVWIGHYESENKFESYKNDLVDALWIAVKEILKHISKGE